LRRQFLAAAVVAKRTQVAAGFGLENIELHGSSFRGRRSAQTCRFGRDANNRPAENESRMSAVSRRYLRDIDSPRAASPQGAYRRTGGILRSKINPSWPYRCGSEARMVRP
jgi:hypothetical protein